MNASKIKHSNGWIISDIINNHLVTRTYYGYTRTEAITRFSNEVKE